MSILPTLLFISLSLLNTSNKLMICAALFIGAALVVNSMVELYGKEKATYSLISKLNFHMANFITLIIASVIDSAVVCVGLLYKFSAACIQQFHAPAFQSLQQQIYLQHLAHHLDQLRFINFINSNYNRNICCFCMIYCFNCLFHDSIVSCNYYYNYISNIGTTCTHRSERFMSWCINKTPVLGLAEEFKLRSNLSLLRPWSVNFLLLISSLFILFYYINPSFLRASMIIESTVSFRFSLLSAEEEIFILSPLTPTQAPTGSMFLSGEKTATLDLEPASLAIPLIVTNPSAISVIEGLPNIAPSVGIKTKAIMSDPVKVRIIVIGMYCMNLPTVSGQNNRGKNTANLVNVDDRTG
uniref:Uncharacterized protein n=1 Tax=Glossina austeni TaxID=7395 RepID=A0A1A9VJR4_GLOAU